MRNLQAMLCAIGLVAAAGMAASAHEGPQDSYGCHPNVAHGTYHCHRGPLAGRQFPSRQRMLRAYEEKQQTDRPKPRAQVPRF